MIVAELEHMTGQIAPTPNMQRALDFLGQVRGADLPTEGWKSTATGSSRSYSRTRPSRRASRSSSRCTGKYIDVQYVAAGEELVAWASTDHLPVTADYDEAKEAWFGARGPRTHLRAAGCRRARGLLPDRRSRPAAGGGRAGPLKKIVVKVAVES